MSTIEQQRSTRQGRKAQSTSTLANKARPAFVRKLSQARVSPIVDRRQSARTSVVFRAILGGAACLALVGVVAEADRQSAPTSVDDPPPAVFIQTD